MPNVAGSSVLFKWCSGGYSMVINCKIRHIANKNRPTMRPAIYGVVWPHGFFHYLWWQKNGKTWSGYASYGKGSQPWREVYSVYELARALFAVGQWILLPSQLTICENKVANLMWLVIKRTKNWSSHEFFLENYVNEGDSQKISSANDSQ